MNKIITCETCGKDTNSAKITEVKIQVCDKCIQADDLSDRVKQILMDMENFKHILGALHDAGDEGLSDQELRVEEIKRAVREWIANQQQQQQQEDLR